MPTSDSRYSVGRGTLSLEMADGTRITMNALDVSIVDMSERLEHYSLRGGARVPDGSILINQEFKIEAVGPGMEMLFPNEPLTIMGVQGSPLAGFRVERLPDSEELAKQQLMRVIRMDRRENVNSEGNVESGGANDSEVVRVGAEPPEWDELAAHGI
jgi:hypothetical protein